MSCERFDDLLLSAWIDGDAPPQGADYDVIAEHVDHCADCAERAEGLRQVRRVAATLADDPVSSDGWAAIADELRDERTRRATPRGWPRAVPLAAAAAVLVALGGLLLYARLEVPSGSDDATRWRAEQRARVELDRLEQQQRRATSALDALLRARKGTWDASLARTYAENLEIVDGAIADCRRALARKPGDPVLRGSLVAAYQRKLEFLRLFVEADAPQTPDDGSQR